MARQIEVVPDPEQTTPPPASGIGKTTIRTAVTRTGAKAPIEPQMAALVRILGDEVLDIFPEPMRDAVDTAYTFWQTHPDSYLDTEFGSKQERDDVLIVLRAYAEAAPGGPYTIRTVQDENPAMLCWRAQNRRGSGKLAGQSE
jgi:hypothetical protein